MPGKDERLVIVVKNGPSQVAFGQQEAQAKAAQMRKEFPGRKVTIQPDQPDTNRSAFHKL